MEISPKRNLDNETTKLKKFNGTVDSQGSETKRKFPAQCLGEFPASQDVQQRTDDGMEQEHFPGVGNQSQNCRQITLQRLESNFTDNQSQEDECQRQCAGHK
jgi:hypothetical protein